MFAYQQPSTVVKFIKLCRTERIKYIVGDFITIACNDVIEAVLLVVKCIFNSSIAISDNNSTKISGWIKLIEIWIATHAMQAFANHQSCSIQWNFFIFQNAGRFLRKIQAKSGLFRKSEPKKRFILDDNQNEMEVWTWINYYTSYLYLSVVMTYVENP